MKKISISIGLGLLTVFLITCQFSEKQPSVVPKTPKKLADYFQPITAADTMLFELKQEEDQLWTDTIPNSLLFMQMEPHLMNDVEYFDNSGDLIVIGRSRFPLMENREAYLVEMRQHWFRHLSLFIYDETRQIFSERETVAEFYGGEGGQILTGSWFFDCDQDGDKDLVQIEIEHWIILDEDNSRDTLAESARLLVCYGDNFREEETNTAALLRQYPIASWW